MRLAYQNKDKEQEREISQKIMKYFGCIVSSVQVFLEKMCFVQKQLFEVNFLCFSNRYSFLFYVPVSD